MKSLREITGKPSALYLVVLIWITCITHRCLTIWFDWETVRFFVQPRPGQFRWLSPWYSGWVDLSDYGIRAASLTLRPLMTYFLQIQAILFQSWSPGYHMVSLTLHLACVLCLILVLRKLGLSIPSAALGGLIFGVHPLSTQPLWILADSAETCVLVFGLLALYYYDQKPLVSACAVVTALYCKETAITIPAWLLIYDLLFLDRAISLKRSARFRLRRISLPTIVTVFYLVHRTLAFQGLGGYGSVDHGRLQNNFDVISQNTAWLFTFAHHHSLFIWIFVALLVLAFIPRVPRVFRFGMLWFVIFLLPINNLCNKWYLYTPVAALSTCFLGALDPLIRRTTTRYATIFFCLSVSLYLSMISVAELNFQLLNADKPMAIASQLKTRYPSLPSGSQILFQLPPGQSEEAFPGHYFRPSNFKIQKFRPPLESIVWDLNGTRFTSDGKRVWSRSVEAAVRLLYNDITLTVKLTETRISVMDKNTNTILINYNPETGVF